MKKILLLGASTVMTAAIAAPLLSGQLQVGNGSEKVIEAKVKPAVAQGHKVAPVCRSQPQTRLDANSNQ